MSNHPMRGLPDPLPADPLQVAEKWLMQARDEQLQPNPNAMTLATVGANGQPAARVVLCKEIMLPDGYLVFYTNYESRKGAELAAQPRAAALFHWDAFERQVRVEGFVVRSPAAESDDYFRTRPWQSRLGAWASQQSQPLSSREALMAEAARVAVTRGPNPPRPPHWGGFRIRPVEIEFWADGAFRLHDRFRWRRDAAASGWSVERLNP
jgi:pyridoxamine 5'-phosphate oxidase